MKQGKWTWVAVVAIAGGMALGGGGTMAAPASQPATTRPAGRVTHRKLTKPWSEMQTLTPRQQEQIEKVHADTVLQEKQIHDKEHDDIVALLTPEQQTELADMEAKEKAAQKEKTSAGRKKKTDPTSQPMKK